MTSITQTSETPLKAEDVLKFILIHSWLFGVFFVINYYVIDWIPSFTVDFWDVGWYRNIVENGYWYSANGQSNVAFFPLFPWVLKLLDGQLVLASLLNLLLFLTGLIILYIVYKPSKYIIPILLAIPSNLFLYVPYSESIFYLAVVLFLVGMDKRNIMLACIGIFLASMARSSFSIFVPALLITGAFFSLKERKLKWEYILYLITSLAGLAIVLFIMYYQTGEPWGIFKAQRQWGHHFRMPEMPFFTYMGTLKIDGVALLVGAISLIPLIKITLGTLLKKMEIEISPSVFFSLLYFVGISLSIVFFQGGDLRSLNRYVFATPFIFFFFIYLFKQQFHFTKSALIILVGSLLFWLIFYDITHSIRVFANYLAVSIFLSAFIYLTHPQFKKGVFWVLYLGMLYLQAYYFVRFLTGQWVG